MAMRRESGRAFGSGPKHTPTRRTKTLKRTSSSSSSSTSSLGSNAAAAHGYTQRGPTRKLKPPTKPKPQPQTRTTLRSAYQQDVAEENQRGSAAQRGATFRRQAQATADRDAAAKRKAAAKPKSNPSLASKALRLLTREAPKALAKVNPAADIGSKAVSALSHAPKGVQRELSGTGKLADASAKLAESTVKHGFTVQTGGGPAGALTARKSRKSGGRTPVAALTAKQVNVRDMPGGAQRALKDLIDFPAAAPASVYEPARAAVKAAQGDTRPAKKLVKQIKDTDPLYAAATGDFKKAGKLASEHPGFTALEVIGAKGAIGRGAGRVIRGTGKTMKATGRVTGSRKLARAGKVVHRIAETDTRPNATRPGTGLSESRQYSRDVTTKAAQVAYDRRRTARARKLHRQADRATDPDVRDRKRQAANEADPLYMSDKKVNRHVDLQESAVANRARRTREDVDKRVTKILRKAGDKGGAQVTVLHGITKADVADLRAYRAELEHAHAGLEDAGKRRANERLRKNLDVSIKAAERGRLRRLDMERVAEAAREYSRDIDVPVDKRLADLGLLPEERGVRAKLVPFAARAMGARTVDKAALRAAATEARGVERKTGRKVRRAQRSLQTAERRELRETGRARLLGEDADRVAHRLEGVDVDEAMTQARKGARTAGTLRRKAQRQQLSQESRAGRAHGRAEIIVGRSADVRSRKVRPGDATRPRRTLAKLQREQAGTVEARVRVQSALKAERAAEVTLGEARRARDAVQRRRRADRGRARLERRTADVENARAGVARAEQDLAAARVAREAAEADAKRIGLANPDNSPLDWDAVAQRAVSERDAPPSYLPQGRNARGARNYYTAAAREPTVSSRARTERATVEGAYDADPEVARASAIHRENIANAAESFRDSVNQIARRDSKGEAQKFSYDQALNEAESIHARTGQQFVPVQYEPWRATAQQRDAMREALSTDDPRGATTLRDGMVETLEKAGGGKPQSPDGSYVLVPKAAASRMAEHLKVLDPSDIGKMAQAFRTSFSRTVLSTSLSPLFGNLFEGAFRSAVARAGPLSLHTMHRVLREMTPEQRAAVQDRVFTGGKVTLSVKPRHFDAEQIQAPTMRKIAAGWGAVKRAPVNRQLSAAWQQWTHFMTTWANGKIERGTQAAMAGKIIRDSGLMGDGLLRLSDKAFKQAAEGLTNTAEMNRLADGLVRDFGKYDALSPAQRRIVGNYAPFAAWWWSAARFVGMLPINHPAFTALLTANTRAVTDFKKLDATPMWLRGTRPVGNTSLQMARNTPFGAFADPIGTVGSLILPQGQSLLFNAQGLDWKGDKLRNPDGSEYTPMQTAGQIAQTLAESSIPVYAAPKRAIGYAQDPGALLNPVRIRHKPSKGKRKLVKRKSDLPPLPDLPDLPDLPPLPK